ncbi:predicted protein [Sclerotinia sclerotiorum 1980 UF-70]|uniref:Uncharacterized protein n=1 Tax=Sclerotinia sclerotiorum (strain ATCC 18683 / 1980 / Ss-1) TaxID=665079 RepID=A7F2I0_SCLS1|nr:predicted protein [Sclerotinia sclerotiorum 1980 UF-70]EDN95922.1 predicted protein [Sclerotinia sclerotiorum 1980 UF-70]
MPVLTSVNFSALIVTQLPSKLLKPRAKIWGHGFSSVSKYFGTEHLNFALDPSLHHLCRGRTLEILLLGPILEVIASLQSAFCFYHTKSHGEFWTYQRLNSRIRSPRKELLIKCKKERRKGLSGYKKDFVSITVPVSLKVGE